MSKNYFLILIIGLFSIQLSYGQCSLVDIERLLLNGYNDSAKVCLEGEKVEGEDWYIKRLAELVLDRSPDDFTPYYALVNKSLNRHALPQVLSYVESSVTPLSDQEEYDRLYFKLYWVLMGRVRDYGDIEKANELYYDLENYVERVKKQVPEDTYKSMQVRLLTHQAVLALIQKDVDRGLEICDQIKSISTVIRDTGLIVAGLYHQCDFLFLLNDLDGYIETAEEAYKLNTQASEDSDYISGIRINLVNAYLFKRTKPEMVKLILNELESDPGTLKQTYILHVQSLSVNPKGSDGRRKVFEKFGASDIIEFCSIIWEKGNSELYKTDQFNLVNEIANQLNINGEYKESNKYFRIKSGLQEELYNTQLSEELLKLNTKLEVREKELELQKIKSNSQRNYLILSGVGLLVLLLLLFFYLKYQKGKRQKAKIEDYNAQLTEISKVKNRFFTNIAHELRTPITLLMGPLEFVQSRNNDLSRESKMMVDLAYENATKLSTKVDEILELSNLENNRIRISPMRINLKDFFNGIYTLYKASAEFKGLGMKLDYDDDSDSLFITDEKHLETIVTNVLSNALKHAPDHSEIELKVSRRSGVLSVGVSDRGGKLTPKQQSKIFDSFFQTERGQEVGGFGIGLALSKQLALILNGDIEVDVAKDVRTTFTLIIPELEIVNESQEVEETSEGFTPVADIDFASQPTVLIVEDKVEMRAYLRQILKSDFKLLETDDGAEVMDILEYNAVDAIVCDLMMPKMRGEDIVELVKADPSTKGIPILILSAKDNLDAKLELFERGVADFITKPFSSQELIARLHRSLVMERKPQDKVDDFTYSNADDLWLNKVKDYVTQNVSNSSLKVSDIADNVGMVERTFRRKLKSLTGHSPLDFVKEIRLNHAYNLLKNNSHQTVKEVAHASGFNRSDFFTKEFKKRFGKVPKDIV